MTATLASIPQIVEAGIQLLISLIQALPQIITTILTAIPQIIGGITNALTNIGLIASTGFQVFVAHIKNLPSIIVEIIRAVPQIIAGIVQAFTSSMGQISNVGANIVRGLWQGIQSLAGWLWNKVSAWIRSIWDGICNFFGIHSPSNLFDWAGQMMVQGLAGAISRDGDEAIKATLDMSHGISHAVNNLAADMNTSLAPEITVKGTLSKGKKACSSKQIPEDILIAVTAKVLGTEPVTEELLQQNLSDIFIADENLLVFHFRDGRTISHQWQDRSRSESWTPRMKEAARNRALERRNVNA